jgi:AcrR family transcriptional regulator
VIAQESGANLASIAYHFGSKDDLITEAVIEGLDRWLADIARRLHRLPPEEPAARFRAANQAIEATRTHHTGLARTFLSALVKAPHDPRVNTMLTDGFRRTRPTVASLLGLGDDQPGQDAGGLVLAMFYGLLFQALIDPALAIEGDRMTQALARLHRILPDRKL